MNENFSPLTNRKSYIFATAAAIGCFIAALVAELLFLPPPPRYTPPQPPYPKFCLTFDDSGSMDNRKKNAVKEAAKSFVQNRNLEHEKVAIVVFSTESKIFLQLSHDKDRIIKTIDTYSHRGGTVFQDALDDSISVFQNNTEILDEEKQIKEINEKIKEQNEKDKKSRRKKEPLKEQTIPKIVLFFTDGENTDRKKNPEEDPTLLKAAELREKGIMLFAVATLDGNRDYLEKMTGDASRVFMTNDQNIGDAFKQAEEKIKEITKNDTFLGESHDTSWQWEITRAVVWSALLCYGMLVSIIIVQNYFMQKPFINQQQLTMFLKVSIVAGLFAGFSGDTFYRILLVGAFGRMIAWGVLGAILAVGISYYIANLDRYWALVGGVIGGVFGAVGFLIFSLLGDTCGRLIGAIILGACIGAMIGFVESGLRKIWLMVVYSPRKVSLVTLGSQPVSVGSGNDDTILVKDVPPSAGVFTLDGNNIRYKNSNGSQLLTPGDKINIGTVEFIVHSKDTKFAASKYYPVKMERAKILSKRNNNS
ncbi:MAG: VWA domain-containing protein [Planctomycetaceae bacterium]|jgi:Ca-activated chloride channel family protein|nr:VWA domain-containing protein [Planctomycetaceae bacterium]